MTKSLSKHKIQTFNEKDLFAYNTAAGIGVQDVAQPLKCLNKLMQY